MQSRDEEAEAPLNLIRVAFLILVHTLLQSTTSTFILIDKHTHTHTHAHTRFKQQDQRRWLFVSV